MHYHCEIILPPGVPIKETVAQVLRPFNETLPEDDEGKCPGFWDWYQIGGRWTGAHDPSYDPEADPRNRAEPGDPLGQPNGVLWPTRWAPFEGDVMPISAIPEGLSCARLIVAGPSYDDSKIEASFMLSDSIWNGVNFEKTNWDKTVQGGLSMFSEHCSMRSEQWVQRHLPTDDWLAVTVDYHS